MPSKIINIGLRFAQAVFGAVVLALSITLIKGQRYGMSPAATNYSSFVGAFTLLGAFIGLAATWIEFLQSFIGIGIDALILLFNLAGGVAVAVKIGSINCSSGSDEQHARMAINALINGGCGKDTFFGKEDTFCGYSRNVEGVDDKGQYIFGDWDSGLNSRCKENSAESAFMLINVVLLAGIIVLTWLSIRKYK